MLSVVYLATSFTALADQTASPTPIPANAELRQHMRDESRQFHATRKDLIARLHAAKTSEDKQKLITQLKALSAAHHADFEKSAAALKASIGK